MCCVSVWWRYSPAGMVQRLLILVGPIVARLIHALLGYRLLVSGKLSTYPCSIRLPGSVCRRSRRQPLTRSDDAYRPVAVIPVART